MIKTQAKNIAGGIGGLALSAALVALLLWLLLAFVLNGPRPNPHLLS